MSTLGRLKKRPEFLRVAAGRRKWVTPGLILQALPRQGARETASAGTDTPDSEVRYGITVSRKVGNSVQRNRARRRLRAAARELLPVVGRPGTDYVIIGRKTTLSRDYAELKDDLKTAVERLASPGAGAGRTRGRRKEPAQASRPAGRKATDTQDPS